VLYGHPTPEQGTWRDRLVWDREDLVQRTAAPGDARAKEAVSEYRVRQRLRGASLVEVRLVTGKRNQIRVQAALRGHPLVGETMYVDGPPARPIRFSRQALHAWRLRFTHPVTGRAVRLEAPLPDDMAGLVEELASPRD
jgi:23S rRNA pseudouridine1911/1915/1917 synthase